MANLRPSYRVGLLIEKHSTNHGKYLKLLWGVVR